MNCLRWLFCLTVAAFMTSCQGDSSGPQSGREQTPQSTDHVYRKGWILGPDGWFPGRYADYGSYAIFENDMILRKSRYSNEFPQAGLGLITATSISKWPLKPGQKTIEIPYELDPNLVSEARRSVQASFADLNAKLPILFRTKQTADTAFLYVTHTPQHLPKVQTDRVTGLASFGYQTECFEDNLGDPVDACGSQGANEVFVSNRPSDLQDPRYSALITHEIGHSLGMGHEFSRADRANFITVNLNNVDDSFKGGLGTDATLTALLPFDFQSVMMYYAYLFRVAVDKTKPVITKTGVTGRKSVELGGWEISARDRQAVSLLYADSGAPQIYGNTLESEALTSLPTNGTLGIVFSIADKDVVSWAAVDCNTLVSADVLGNVAGQTPRLSATIVNENGSPDTLTTLGGLQMSGRKCRVNLTSSATPGWYSVVLRMYNDSSKTGQPSSRVVDVRVGMPATAPQGISFKQQPLSVNTTLPEQTFIGLLSTVDADIGDSHLYSIEPELDADSFIVMAGRILAAKPLTKDTYTLRVVSEDRSGNTTSKYIQINRGDAPTSGSVAVTATVAKGNTGSWIELQAVEALGNTSKFKSFLWEFSDKTTGRSKSFSKFYTTPGTYDVLLRATDESGQLFTRASEFVIPNL